jgi:hypothetical protein
VNLFIYSFIHSFIRTFRCATSRTVPGSIPGGLTGFFSDISPSDRTMALGSTQPLMKMSTRNIPGGKGGRCVRLTTSPLSHAECQEIWEPKPPGTLWATPGLLRDSSPPPFETLELPRILVYRPATGHSLGESFCSVSKILHRIRCARSTETTV